MKRRRRGLGSSAAVHRDKAASWGKLAIESAGESMKEALAGACGRALTGLLDAERALGHEQGEITGTGRGVPATSLSAVDQANTLYRQRCIRR